MASLTSLKTTVSIPYGKGKEWSWESTQALYRMYQFPVGKVKLEADRIENEIVIVSIPYGKGKGRGSPQIRRHNWVSIPYGKGKEDYFKENGELSSDVSIPYGKGKVNFNTNC